MIKPLMNHCLIEVVDQYGGVIRNRADESRKKGILLAYNLLPDHLTASTGYTIQNLEGINAELADAVGKVVRYEQYADEGQTFDEDGKKYAMVYWWRLMGVEPEGIDNVKKS